VRVHYNLRTHVWSISIKVPGKGWRVADHRESVTLRHARPVVSRAGVDRIRAKQSREVVARIEGTIGYYSKPIDEPVEGRRVRFNPYRSYDFTFDTGEAYTGSTRAYFPSGVGYFTT